MRVQQFNSAALASPMDNILLPLRSTRAPRPCGGCPRRRLYLTDATCLARKVMAPRRDRSVVGQQQRVAGRHAP